MFHWKKKGLIFDPTGRLPWMQAYSQVPTVLDDGETWRIYFTCRPAPDGQGRFVSHTAYLDVPKSAPDHILHLAEEPVMSLGAKGAFDEFGVHPTAVLRQDNSVYLYYTGWARGTSVPYATWIGLAISTDGGRQFTRVSEGPVIGPNRHDPFLANGAYVFEDEGRFRMVYASASKWVEENGKMEPVYTLKHAVSDDAIDWEISECPNLLPSTGIDECISRPSLIRIGSTYHMWYAHRSFVDYRGGVNSYRIGYSRSEDFEHWERLDESAGIELSESGWDSGMMAYPQVVRSDDRLLMFYNGNYFGREGFGYAEAGLGS